MLGTVFCVISGLGSLGIWQLQAFRAVTRVDQHDVGVCVSVAGMGAQPCRGDPGVSKEKS